MSSSEQEQVYTFRSADLPMISIPSSYSSSISSHSDTPLSTTFPFTVPRTPIDDVTDLSTSVEPPLTPTGLGTAFSRVDLLSQTSEESDFASSKVPGLVKRRIHKVHTGQFQKGVGVKRKISSTPATRKRLPTSKPKSLLFENVKFPPTNKRATIKVRKNDVTSLRDLYVPQGSQIIDMAVLRSVFSLLRCTQPDCTGSLKLYQHSFRDGLQSYLLLKCGYCHLEIATFPTSVPIGMRPDDSVNDPQMLHRKKSEVNYRALLATHCTSNSWADFLLTCNILGIENTWNHMPKVYLSNLVQSSAKVCDQSMSLTGARVYDSAEAANISQVKKCTVSFDATWHQRGHYSNQGFAAAIEVYTGKVLDYALYERICSKCLKWSVERKEENPEEYVNYWEKHSSECPANFKGSSQSMESSAALEIWARSVGKHRLAYTTYVGDGDSSSFKRLSDSDPYNGEEVVRKEECLGHTQKRLKKHLKKPATKAMTSKPISPTKVDRIGHLYALVVVQNRGRTPEDIQRALYTMQEHLDEKHDSCPFSTNSWCYFQKALALVAEDASSLPPCLRQSFLNPDELSRLRDVFKKFASIEMCSALTLGMTQNSNESLHSVLWHNAPKGKRIGQKSLQASAALSVSTFNEGSMILAAVLADLGVQ